MFKPVTPKLDVKEMEEKVLRHWQRQDIFLPFRKLTTSESVLGQGMGLALVRRAVEGMGGQISVGSATSDGRGTVFTVHWPLP